MLKLDVEKREIIGKKAKRFLRDGKIPAVMYGKKEPSQPLVVREADFLKIWREAGESTVVILSGLEEEKQALIHTVDLDPVKDTPRHADFYVIEKGQKVEVDVPIEFVGIAPAVKEQGGVLVKVLHELSVEADPAALPHSIEVDVSILVNFESQILVRDVATPGGVVVLNDPEEVVVLVQEAVEEVEEALTEPIDLTKVEVEQKGKKEEGASEEGATSSAA